MKDASFSLSDLGLQKHLSTQLYDDMALDDNGNFIPFDEQVAMVTHYLVLLNSGITLPYSLRAQKLIERWTKIYKKEHPYEIGISEEPYIQTTLFKEVFNVPFPGPKNPKFTFIDLFAGIGGFRMALQNLGGQCVFSSEWDEQAKKTYYANYGEVPFGDITKESVKQCIPDNFDILCAGFPCQAFSIAGYQKGFEDTRGTLFFDVAEIIKRKRPKAVYLENVKNLASHDNGNTFKVIKTTLEELGYKVFSKVMNSMEYANIPQNRERIFIVCFDPKQIANYDTFSFPQKEHLTKTIKDCIDYSDNNIKLFYTDKMSHYKELTTNITSQDTVYQWRRQYVRENKSKVCPTLTANMGTGGHNVPLILTDKGIRKLSPKECLNFQGFPKEYKFPNIADSAKYKQAGNSVVVPLIYKVCQQITKTMSQNS